MMYRCTKCDERVSEKDYNRRLSWWLSSTTGRLNPLGIQGVLSRDFDVTPSIHGPSKNAKSVEWIIESAQTAPRFIALQCSSAGNWRIIDPGFVYHDQRGLANKRWRYQEMTPLSLRLRFFCKRRNQYDWRKERNWHKMGSGSRLPMP